MEILDVLDINGNPTGKTIIRGDKLQEDEYILIVHIWIVNSKGQILIQKRPDNRKFAPGLWATTGGAATHGENSLESIYREVKEELGIEVDKSKLLGPLKYMRDSDIIHIWAINQDIELSDIVLQKEEVEDVKWVTKLELQNLIEKGKFYNYTNKYFKLLSKYIDIF